MNERLNKQERLFSKLTLFVLVVYQVGIYLTYSKSTSGDFAIYFRAGIRVRQGLDIYNFEENLFVYGPLLAHLLSFLAKSPILVVSNVWLFTSLLLSWVNSFLLLKLVLDKVSLSKVIFATGLMTFSFAFRNNAGNGSVMMIVLFAFLFIFNCVRQQSKEIPKIVLASFLLVLVIELKTYLAVYLIIYLMVIRRINIIFMSAILMGFSNLLYYLFDLETYFEWIKEIMVRSENIETGSDQATVLVFTKSIFPDSFLASWAIFLIFFLILIRKSKQSINQDYMSQKFPLLIMAVAPLGTIFAHGQDFVLSVSSLTGFLLLHEKNKFRGAPIILALSALVNWTNSELHLGIATCLLLVLLLQSYKSVAFVELISIIIGLVSSLFVLNWLRFIDGDLQFRYYNFQGLLFALAVWLLMTRSLEKK